MKEKRVLVRSDSRFFESWRSLIGTQELCSDHKSGRNFSVRLSNYRSRCRQSHFLSMTQRVPASWLLYRSSSSLYVKILTGEARSISVSNSLKHSTYQYFWNPRWKKNVIWRPISAHSSCTMTLIWQWVISLPSIYNQETYWPRMLKAWSGRLSITWMSCRKKVW